MESISAANEIGETLALVNADTLRDMTITKEDLLTRQKADILQSLMSSMVSIASNNGGFEYSANLNPLFDLNLLSDIRKELEALNYIVSTSTEKTEGMGEFISLTVSWEDADVSDRSEEQ